MKQRFLALFLSATLLFGAASCSGAGLATSSTTSAASQSVVVSTLASAAQPSEATSAAAAASMPATSPVMIDYDAADVAEASATPTVAASIELVGDAITIDGSGAVVKGSVVTITNAGRYTISGKLNDGQIVVDTQDAQNVMLELAGADITNTAGAPIYVANAEKVIITLADGTQNTVTDGANYIFADAQTTEPDAAIFGHDDLTINGTGSLTVNANFKNGITRKDDLKITAAQSL